MQVYVYMQVSTHGGQTAISDLIPSPVCVCVCFVVSVLFTCFPLFCDRLNSLDSKSSHLLVSSFSALKFQVYIPIPIISM